MPHNLQSWDKRVPGWDLQAGRAAADRHRKLTAKKLEGSGAQTTASAFLCGCGMCTDDRHMKDCSISALFHGH
jgi:hypothetical protein